MEYLKRVFPRCSQGASPESFLRVFLRRVPPRRSPGEFHLRAFPGSCSSCFNLSGIFTIVFLLEFHQGVFTERTSKVFLQGISTGSFARIISQGTFPESYSQENSLETFSQKFLRKFFRRVYFLERIFREQSVESPGRFVKNLLQRDRSGCFSRQFLMGFPPGSFLWKFRVSPGKLYEEFLPCMFLCDFFQKFP